MRCEIPIKTCFLYRLQPEEEKKEEDEIEKKYQTMFVEISVSKASIV